MRRSSAPSRAVLSPASVARGGLTSGDDATSNTAIATVGTPLPNRAARRAQSPSPDIKRVNTAALQEGSVSVVRAPLLGCLTVPRGGGLVVGAFKLPGGARRTDKAQTLLKRKSLGVRRPITFMTSSKFRVPSAPDAPVSGDFELQEGEEGTGDGAEAAPPATAEEDKFEPLVLWQAGSEEEDHRISVDPRLCKWLRPHQREGVQFMFECVMGMREFEGNGCILADDMGLGKTLQSIAVLWTLLKQGKEKGQPAVKRAIVVCPTSLVKNWEAEIEKWLKGDCRVIALSETTRDQVVQSINLFLASMVYRVLIVSYETFRLHSKRFYAKADTCCDLLICDEAHRLKNADTATNQALSALKCRKRVLLSGTPMQNDLEEFYAMTDFTNPGVLGSGSSFRKHFLAPILAGREPSATDKQVERAQKCQNEMSTVVNEFILRRTNNINAKHLPPKLVQVVCCRLTPLQRKIYKHLLSSKEIRHILNGKQTNILSSIGAMQKLCNHPKLLVEGSAGRDRDSGLAEVASFLPTAAAGEGRGSGAGGFGHGRRGGGGVQKGVFPEWSGKMETLYRLMKEMRNTGDDRIVVVSNYTQSLDLIGSMCRENSWPFVRLDGSTGVSKRQKMVDAFNLPGPQSFAFLLSSKAGGCGLNLIGGNRLVLFDPDWNPAVDKQAAARVWRDGQKKRCFVYRFVSTGTIEEKVFQRQLSKEGLQNIVDDKEEVNSLSSKDLKDLFKLYDGTPSDTHDKLRCKRCRIEEAVQAVKDADAEAFRQALPKQLTLCQDLLSDLSAQPAGEAFLQQWDPEAEGTTAEAYANAVHEPMDFGLISSKLRLSIEPTSTPVLSSSPPASSAATTAEAEDNGMTSDGQEQRLVAIGSTDEQTDRVITDVPSTIVTTAEGDGRKAQRSTHEGSDVDDVAPNAAPEEGVASTEDAVATGGTGAGTGDASAVSAAVAAYTSLPSFPRDMNLVFSNVRRMWPMGSVGSENRLTKAADTLKMAFDLRWRELAPLLHSIQREALENAREEAKVKAAEALAEEGEGEDCAPPARFQEQMGMPKEEDLNSWSHHYSTDTADDPVFRGAMMGTGDSLVSFVFGLKVTWDLLQIQLEEEAEARKVEIKMKTEARAARAAEKAARIAAEAAEDSKGAVESAGDDVERGNSQEDRDEDKGSNSGGRPDGIGGQKPKKKRKKSDEEALRTGGRKGGSGGAKRRKKVVVDIDEDSDDGDDDESDEDHDDESNAGDGLQEEEEEEEGEQERSSARRKKTVASADSTGSGGDNNSDGSGGDNDGDSDADVELEGERSDDDDDGTGDGSSSSSSSRDKESHKRSDEEAWMFQEKEPGLEGERVTATSRSRRKVMDALEDSDEGEDGAEEEVEEACSGGGTQMEEPVASSQKEGEGTDGDFDEEDEVMETPLATASEDAPDDVDIDSTTKKSRKRIHENELDGGPSESSGSAFRTGDDEENIPLNGTTPGQMATPSAHAAGTLSSGAVDERNRISKDNDASNVDGQHGNDSADNNASEGKGATATTLKAKTTGKVGEWVCATCTFANSVSKRKCSMCMEGIRPAGMGRSHPLSPRSAGEENRNTGQQQHDKQGKQSKETAPKKKQAKDKKRRKDVWLDDDEDFE